MLKLLYNWQNMLYDEVEEKYKIYLYERRTSTSRI